MKTLAKTLKETIEPRCDHTYRIFNAKYNCLGQLTFYCQKCLDLQRIPNPWFTIEAKK